MITGNQAVPKGRYEVPIAISADTLDALHDIRDTLTLHKVSEVTIRQCEHVLDELVIVNQALDNLQNDIAKAYKNAAEYVGFPLHYAQLVDSITTILRDTSFDLARHNLNNGPIEDVIRKLKSTVNKSEAIIPDESELPDASTVINLVNYSKGV